MRYYREACFSLAIFHAGTHHFGMPAICLPPHLSSCYSAFVKDTTSAVPCYRYLQVCVDIMAAERKQQENRCGGLHFSAVYSNLGVITLINIEIHYVTRFSH